MRRPTRTEVLAVIWALTTLWLGGRHGYLLIVAPVLALVIGPWAHRLWRLLNGEREIEPARYEPRPLHVEPRPEPPPPEEAHPDDDGWTLTNDVVPPARRPGAGRRRGPKANQAPDQTGQG